MAFCSFFHPSNKGGTFFKRQQDPKSVTLILFLCLNFSRRFSGKVQRVLFIINDNRIAFPECPVEDLHREGIQYLSLQRPLQRPCPIDRVEPDIGKIFLRLLRQLYIDIFFRNVSLHPVHLYLHDLLEELFGQRIEDDDLINPVQELRSEE